MPKFECKGHIKLEYNKKKKNFNLETIYKCLISLKIKENFVII